MTLPDPMPASRRWEIVATDGRAVSGRLPSWAQEDPSRTDVNPERLQIAVADVVHEASFGGYWARVCPAGIDPGQDSVILAAHLQLCPHADDAQAREPAVHVHLADDVWIKDLSPDAVANLAETLHDFAHLLTDRVAPGLTAAHTEWTNGPRTARPLPDAARPSPSPRTRKRPRRLHQEPEVVTWAREKAGLTKRALAQSVGISEQLMNEVESGWRSATPANLAKIAKVLNCPVVALERTRETRAHGGRTA